MTTKHRFRGRYRLELREEDHIPMHVHLVGGGVDVVISLETLTVTQGLVDKKLLSEVMAWVSDHHAELVKEWKKWHK